MKVKILKSSMNSYWYSNDVNKEFNVHYNITDRSDPFRHCITTHFIRNEDSVITELPEEFCVNRCDYKKKWEKYIKWLNKKYYCVITRDYEGYPYYGKKNVRDSIGQFTPFGTEIHIDDMIKHIDYMESQQHIKGGEQFSKESQLTVNMNEEFDLTTDKGRLAYAKKHYPIGTRFKALNCIGDYVGESTSEYEPRLWGDRGRMGIENSMYGLVYSEITNRWAEIIKEETNMETQKLSRQGLKEIHGVACPNWKDVLEHYGSRNPLEDYIELTQEEVDKMFNACTKEQLPIVSKYLNQIDGGINFDKISGTILISNAQELIAKRCFGEYEYKSFYLHREYNWEIRKDSQGELCLIPTKKK
jgi:hypothetical protein